MGVFTQVASNIKGFAPKFACKSANASCVNWALEVWRPVTPTMTMTTTTAIQTNGLKMNNLIPDKSCEIASLTTDNWWQTFVSFSENKELSFSTSLPGKNFLNTWNWTSFLSTGNEERRCASLAPMEQVCPSVSKQTALRPVALSKWQKFKFKDCLVIHAAHFYHSATGKLAKEGRTFSKATISINYWFQISFNQDSMLCRIAAVHVSYSLCDIANGISDYQSGIMID